jgi:hypothetical protein
MPELNPNHPVTVEIREQWYKLCAILMMKFDKIAVEITQKDIESLTDDLVIAADARGGRFVLRLMDRKEGERLARKEGERLARKEGGLPV